MNNLIRKSITILTVLIMIFGMCACTPATDPSDGAKTVRATVIEIEKYGHAVLDLTTADFSSMGYALGDVVRVKFDSYESEMPFYDGYYTNPGDLMLRGLAPEKNIAVCINYGDFSVENGIAVGDSVEITMVEKARMLVYQQLCALQYSNDRADYSDDAVYANFRAVTVGSIGAGKLYRSASPINNEHGRASYANSFIEAAGVATILNLADSDEDVARYLAEDSASEFYRNLYSSGKVLALDLAGNFFTDAFATSIVEGLQFLAKNEPPYSLHCTEGKDRAGFTAMILEALMGATLDEIIDDYMISFYNYYGISKEAQPERYDAVLNNNLIAILLHVTGAESTEALKSINLESAVTTYLVNHGMSETDITTLKNKLR